MTFLTCKGQENICMAVIPKAGSTSMEMAICGHGTGIRVENHEALSYENSVMFLRHPITRLTSCFSFFWWLHHYGRVTDIMPIELAANYESFIDHILANRDPHWQPQVELVRHEGVMVAKTVHKFEELQLHWEKYFKGLLPWANAHSKAVVTDYRKLDILEYYKDDLNLWGTL